MFGGVIGFLLLVFELELEVLLASPFPPQATVVARMAEPASKINRIFDFSFIYIFPPTLMIICIWLSEKRKRFN